MKIPPVETEYIHAGRRMDGRTDRYDKANRRLPRIIQTPLVRLNYNSGKFISFLTRCRPHARSSNCLTFKSLVCRTLKMEAKIIGKYLAVNMAQHCRRL